jgi:hypothetical protein
MASPGPSAAVATYLVTLPARTSLRIGSAAALGIAVATVDGRTLVTLIKPVAGPLRVAPGLALAVLGAIRAGAVVGRLRTGPRGRLIIAVTSSTITVGLAVHLLG